MGRLFGGQTRDQLAELRVLEGSDDAEVGIRCAQLQARGEVKDVGLILELIDLELLDVLVNGFGLDGLATELADGLLVVGIVGREVA